MKIKDYTPNRPIILGDFGEESKTFPKLSNEEIIAMQPASTQRSMLMDDEEHEKFLQSDIKALSAETDVHKLRPDLVDKRGELTQKAQDINKCRRTRLDRGVWQYAYRKDFTPLIIDGETKLDYEGETNQEWKKHLVATKLNHNTEVQQSKEEKQQKQEQEKRAEWKTMSTWEALKMWLNGGEIKSIDIDNSPSWKDIKK